MDNYRGGLTGPAQSDEVFPIKNLLKPACLPAILVFTMETKTCYGNGTNCPGGVQAA